jgi:hypothetical protein
MRNGKPEHSANRPAKLDRACLQRCVPAFDFKREGRQALVNRTVFSSVRAGPYGPVVNAGAGQPDGPTDRGQALIEVP